MYTHTLINQNRLDAQLLMTNFLGQEPCQIRSLKPKTLNNQLFFNSFSIKAHLANALFEQRNGQMRF